MREHGIAWIWGDRWGWKKRREEEGGGWFARERLRGVLGMGSFVYLYFGGYFRCGYTHRITVMVYMGMGWDGKNMGGNS